MCPVPPTAPPTTTPPTTQPPTTKPPTTLPPTTLPPTTLPPMTAPPTTLPPIAPTTLPPTTVPPTEPNPPTMFPQIKPRADCVKKIGEESFVAVLGWETEFSLIEIEPGEDNMFFPIGRTTDIPRSRFEFDAPFYPAPGLFELSFDGKPTTWVLGSGEVTFSGDDLSTRCVTDEASIEMDLVAQGPVDQSMLDNLKNIMANRMNVPISALEVTSSASTKRQASTTVTVTVTGSSVQPTTVVGNFVGDNTNVQNTRSEIQGDLMATVGPISTVEPDTVTYSRSRQVSSSAYTRICIPFYIVLSMIAFLTL
eukprot:CAMPEP_0168528332 /NCGR_PEP_ID=MMETSP0405-20121227/13189_1 /TAXON_ID=498012 /ORGANISM="Trichosphaerium sp, Strain Am-I-7 wt" /LENGTH=308 /DNA_ID=CAMNT_0008551723 /DNA_START=1381 /DNA_END=2307 /DNA_ORIENTATION=+